MKGMWGMKKKWHDFKQWISSRKLNQKVKYLFLIIISLYVIVFLLMYAFVIRKNMFAYMMTSNLNTMVSIGSNLNGELNNISKTSQLIMGDSNVRNFLKCSVTEKENYAPQVLMLIRNIMTNLQDASSIYLIRDDGNYMDASNSITYFEPKYLKDTAWIADINEKRGGYIIKVNGGGAFEYYDGRPMISMMRAVYDIDTQERIGILIINLSQEILNNTLQDVLDNGRSYAYYDEEGHLLSKGEALKEIEETPITHEDYEQISVGGMFKEKVISYYHVPSTPLRIAGIESISLTKFISKDILGFVLILILLTFLSLSILGIFITHYITTPIQRLVWSMSSVKSGWLRRASLKTSNDEIGELKDSYNKMLIELNRLIDELVENEKQTHRAEIDILQEQIKPHFLYNTLDTIAYLSLEKEKEEVYNAIETLGSFYRKFLSKGSKQITLEEEIAIVKDYCKLQKLRYGDIFEDMYDIDKALLQIKVPKLILQPLVENSLYHGIRLKGEEGIVKITAYRTESHLHIVVYDSGIGMDTTKIEELMNENNSKSFGLKGIIKRIRYYYGVEDVYEIRSEEGVYNEIDLKLPLIGGNHV
ncbi:MAG: histidine kinase [Candidatus Galacturonibacter soehngenii]|uniref:HAMP domain-containing protein n=2 Tax=Candidatus Galacturonatibacter soehngenii TaxID=2307010 RepID=A0A7V7QM66_9FIRM|nr:HAMP domain-containing protein [Candidatus Galacturonibacter soehngenii]MBA4687967.1 histidine kinase [Candidatus Galacturonibacter soehngenii]